MEINIGGKLRSLRQKNNLTQKELADRCELSKGFISQLESNQIVAVPFYAGGHSDDAGSSFHEFFSDEQGDNPRLPQGRCFYQGKRRRDDPLADSQRTEEGYRADYGHPSAGKQDGNGSARIWARNSVMCCPAPVTLMLGGKAYRVRKGDSFSFKPSITALFGKHGQDPGDGALGLHSAEFLRRTFHG